MNNDILNILRCSYSNFWSSLVNLKKKKIEIQYVGNHFMFSLQILQKAAQQMVSYCL